MSSATPGPAITIRPAVPDDVELILGLIRELAEYERALEQVRATPELIGEALFGERPAAEALIAELDGRGVAFALFHPTFSTWEGRPGIWLEDLYVPAEHRRLGIGQRLLARLARITVERGGTRLAWAALEWNQPALDFYAKLGATRLSEWEMLRLEGAALQRLAGPALGRG